MHDLSLYPPHGQQQHRLAGADHQQKLQEHFPMRQNAQGGYELIPPDQLQHMSPQQSPQQQHGHPPAHPQQHQQQDFGPQHASPRRYNPNKRHSLSGLPTHAQQAQQQAQQHYNSLSPYRSPRGRGGMHAPPYSPQRHSPSSRGRGLSHSPRPPQHPFYYGGAPYGYPSLDAMGMEGGGAGDEGENGSAAQLALQMGYAPMLLPVAYGQPQLLMQQPGVPIAAASPLLAGANVPSPSLVPLNSLLLQAPSPLPPAASSAAGSQPPSPASARRDAIRTQLEYYFSVENLVRDYYLRSLMNARGYVSLQTMRSFNKLRQMTGGDRDELVQAAATSHTLKVKRGAVKLRRDWSKWMPPSSSGSDEREEASSEDEGYEQSQQQQQQQQTTGEAEQQPSTPNGQTDDGKAGEMLPPSPMQQPPYYQLNVQPQQLYNQYYMPPGGYYQPYAHLPYPYSPQQQQMLMVQHIQQQQYAAAAAQQQQQQHAMDSYHIQQQQQAHMGAPQGDFKRRLFTNNQPSRGGGGGRGGQMRGQRRGGQFAGMPSPRQDAAQAAMNGPPLP